MFFVLINNSRQPAIIVKISKMKYQLKPNYMNNDYIILY